MGAIAVTKIISINSRLDTTINYAVNPEKTEIGAALGYIENPDKTAGAVYVSAFNCSRKNAYAEMRATQKRFGKTGGVLGYHVILSFKPGEVTPEQAFEYGSEFLKRNIAQKYEAVLAVHLDHAHIHCHMVFNSVSFIDGAKYRNNFKDYFKDIRELSDSICREHELSVIAPQRKGMHYAEWKALKQGRPTIRGQLRAELDEIIKCSYTMQNFWRILKERGYVIHRRGDSIKFTSIIPPYGKKPVRLDNLGEGYTEEAIAQRIRTARNGITLTKLPAAPKRIKMKNFKRKKLKGFTALYFHYLYLFNRIRRRRTPQRVSFFMRRELTKLERYQKQFKFLYSNGIEKMSQLKEYKASRETEIENLIKQRKQLYMERTDENCSEIKTQAEQINAQLRLLRSEVRLCGQIAADAVQIREKFNQVESLTASKEVEHHQQQRRGR